jgi:hypothetical protein
MMSALFRNIPLIELALVLILLGLGGFGSLSLRRGINHPVNSKARSNGKWVLAGLCGLALLAIILLFLVTLIKG